MLYQDAEKIAQAIVDRSGEENLQQRELWREAIAHAIIHAVNAELAHRTNKETFRLIDLERLRQANARRCETSFKHSIHDWSPTDWATAFAGETGEACNLVKKLRRGDPVTPQQIGEEIADAVIYADLLCTRLGIRLEDAICDKFNKVSERVGSDIFLPF